MADGRSGVRPAADSILRGQRPVASYQFPMTRSILTLIGWSSSSYSRPTRSAPRPLSPFRFSVAFMSNQTDMIILTIALLAQKASERAANDLVLHADSAAIAMSLGVFIMYQFGPHG